MDQPTRQALDALQPDDPEGRDALLSHHGEQSEDGHQLAERVAMVDRAIRSTFQEVPVPAGLASKLKAKCRQTVELPPRTGPVSSRRKWVLWSTVASVLLMVALGGIYAAAIALRGNHPISDHDLCSAALEWSTELEGLQWKDDPERVLDSFPICTDVRGCWPNRWMRWETPFDRHAVVYELATSDQADGGIFLFVLRDSRMIDVVSQFLPARPHYTTSRRSAAGCRKDGLIYVLVVEGDEQHYRRFVKRQPEVG